MQLEDKLKFKGVGNDSIILPTELVNQDIKQIVTRGEITKDQSIEELNEESENSEDSEEEDLLEENLEEDLQDPIQDTQGSQAITIQGRSTREKKIPNKLKDCILY